MRIDTDLVIIAGMLLAMSGMAYSLVRQYINRRHTSHRDLDGVEQRLERIEQAIEAMSVEVERIGEGQRFTAQLLSSRPQERSALER
jgi:sensor domain CHASE-containing protein